MCTGLLYQQHEMCAHVILFAILETVLFSLTRKMCVILNEKLENMNQMKWVFLGDIEIRHTKRELTLRTLAPEMSHKDRLQVNTNIQEMKRSWRELIRCKPQTTWHTYYTWMPFVQSTHITSLKRRKQTTTLTASTTNEIEPFTSIAITRMITAER